MTSGQLLSLSAELLTTKGLLLDIEAGVTITRGLLLDIEASIPTPFVVNAGADQSDIEPFDTVSLTASATGGTSPVYSFSSSPALTFSGTGATRTFVAPATMDAQTYVITVSVIGTGASQGQDYVSVTVLPHIEWAARGGVWVGVLHSRL